MKVLFSLILGSSIALSSCTDESEIPDLTPGTYYLEVFDDKGKKLLTRSGEAIGLGSEGQISLFEDPDFIKGRTDDLLNPPNTFAYLFLGTGNEYDIWDQKPNWSMDSPSQATFNQRYYNISGDWAYENVSGEVVITKSTPSLLQGHFEITMHAVPGSKWVLNGVYILNGAIG